MPETLQAVVNALYLYPIKACAGVPVSELHFSEKGSIIGDREWVVVDASHEVVWQGSHPLLALVQPVLLPNALGLSARGEQNITIPYLLINRPCTLRIWNDITKTHDIYVGTDAGDQAAAFLQRVTGVNLRLVHLDDEALARAGIQPLHITSRASLFELNRALVAGGCDAVEMTRFRPNIVISSDQTSLAAFAEEQCVEMRWNVSDEMGVLMVMEPCVRCVVVNVDPISAGVSSSALKKVAELSSLRFSKKSVFFGSYAKVARGKMLRKETVLDLSF